MRIEIGITVQALVIATLPHPKRIRVNVRAWVYVVFVCWSRVRRVPHVTIVGANYLLLRNAIKCIQFDNPQRFEECVAGVCVCACLKVCWSTHTLDEALGQTDRDRV